MIIQTTPYGCGMYAVANALGADVKGFVTDARLEASKAGNTIWQLNKWLEEDGRPFVLDPMYSNLRGGKLPEEWLVNWDMDANVMCTPILIELKYREKSLSHLVAAKVFHGNPTPVIIFDSIKGIKEVTTFEDLNSKYYSITGIYGFQSTENQNWIMYFNS